jgi:hypothetical protein
MSILGDHALAYAKRGLWVFPCKPRSKEPGTWHGLKDATTDENIIAGWWRGNPHFNIGIATGEKSGVFVVDIDGEDGIRSMADLEDRHGVLPPTVESTTGRGLHLFFAYPEGRVVRNSVEALAPGVDVRGQGGSVIAPPSIHPRCAYAWAADSAKAFGAAPDWLLALIAKPTNTRPRAAAPEQWRALVQGVSEGARDSSITKLAGHLLRRRVDPIVVLALLQGFNATYCSPSLPEDDIVRIVDSISGRELKRRMPDG